MANEVAAHAADSSAVHGVRYPYRLDVVTEEDLGADKVLVAADIIAAATWAVDPNGANRNVDLPVTHSSIVGLPFLIINKADAAETLTVRLTGGGTTVCTIAQGEMAFVECYAATAGSYMASKSMSSHEADSTNVHGIANLARINAVTAQALAGDKVLVAGDITGAQTYACDPDGANRNIDLPATGASLVGLPFLIINTADADETLTVRLTGAGATKATIGQGEMAWFMCYAAAAGSWMGGQSLAAHSADTTQVHGITSTDAAQRLGITGADIVLAGDRVLLDADIVFTQIYNIDPGGAHRNVDLPAGSATNLGKDVYLRNIADAAENLVVRLTGGGATVLTLAQGETGHFVCLDNTANAWAGWKNG